MRRNHTSASRPCARALSALALLTCLAAPAALDRPALADEGPQEADAADQAAADASQGDAADTAGTDGSADAAARTAAAKATPEPLSVKSLSTDAIAADAALQDLAPQNCLAVDVEVENETDAVQAFYDALDQARSQAGLAAAVRDSELEAGAWQRAAESVLAHSDIRPDGTAFTTLAPRSAAEVLLWGGAADDAKAEAELALSTLTGDEAYADQYNWLLTATNVGVACVSDADGNLYWAVELAYDGVEASPASVSSGKATYTVAAAAANVVNITLPERLEMKSGETAQATLPATVEGTLWFGSAGYSYDFTGAAVNVQPGNFVWNSANTSIVSVTADGTLTAHKAGTVTISSTDADGSNPRFGGVVVDGGSSSATYDLGDCTLVGITGDDGKGNFYLNDQGSVDVPAFSVMAPDGTVIDPVNYTASVNYNERTGVAVLSVKANSKSELCSGIATRQLTVVDPNAPTADETAGDTQAGDAAGADGAAAADDGSGAQGADVDGSTADEAGGTQDGEGGADDSAAGEGADAQADQGADAGATDADAQDGATADGGQGDQAGDGAGTDGQDGQTADATGTDGTADGTASVDDADAGTDDGQADDASAGDAQADGAPSDGTDDGSNPGDAQGATDGQPQAAEAAGTPETIQTARSIEKGQLTLSFPSLTYTGSPVTATSSTLTLDGETLVEGRDYTLSYSDNTEAGTARAQASGTGAYTGTLETTFDVAPADMSLVSVTMPNLTYTGQAMTPQPQSVTYEAGGTTHELVLGTDYQIVGYTGNLNVGDASVVLQGMGNYTGTLIAGWKVVQQGTADAGTTQTIPQTADPTDLAGMAGLALAGAAALAAGCAAFSRARRGATGDVR